MTKPCESSASCQATEIGTQKSSSLYFVANVEDLCFLQMNELLCVGGSVWKPYSLIILKYIWRLNLKGVTSMKNPFGNIFLSLFRTFPPLGEAVFDLCLCLKLSQLWPLVHKVYVLWRDGLKTKIHELHKPTSQWLKAISFVLTSQKVGHFQFQIHLEKKYQLCPQIRG